MEIKTPCTMVALVGSRSYAKIAIGNRASHVYDAIKMSNALASNFVPKVPNEVNRIAINVECPSRVHPQVYTSGSL